MTGCHLVPVSAALEDQAADRFLLGQGVANKYDCESLCREVRNLPSVSSSVMCTTFRLTMVQNILKSSLYQSNETFVLVCLKRVYCAIWKLFVYTLMVIYIIVI